MARRLFLLRHAKSSWDDPGLADRERPLNKRGLRACKLIAEHLREHEIAPSAAIASPAVRAQQTLERIRPGLPDGTPTWDEARIYDAGAGQLIAVLAALPSDYRSVLLVGHNPGIQDLATTLATDGEQLARVRRKYPTAALATLSFAVGWSELRPGVAELEDFVRPKQLG